MKTKAKEFPGKARDEATKSIGLAQALAFSLRERRPCATASYSINMQSDFDVSSSLCVCVCVYTIQLRV